VPQVVLSGEDGASAYEVAVANGFVGTESQWLASLVGADGDDADVTAHEVSLDPHPQYVTGPELTDTLADYTPGGGGSQAVTSITDNYTATVDDHLIIAVDGGAFGYTVTLPDASENEGVEFLVRNSRTTRNGVTVTATVGEVAGSALGHDVFPGYTAGLISNGTDWILTQPAQAEDLEGVATVDSTETISRSVGLHGRSLFDQTVFASDISSSGYGVGGEAIPDTRLQIILNAASRKLVFAAPSALDIETTLNYGRPINWTESRINFEQRRTVIVIRPTANGYTFNAENIIGWTQPSTSAQTATIYRISWLGPVIGQWFVESRTVLTLPYLGMEDPAQTGLIVCRVSRGGSANWTNWGATAALIDNFPGVVSAVKGVTAHISSEIPAPASVAGHPINLNVSLSTSTAEYNIFQRVMSVADPGGDLVGGVYVMGVVLHELGHVFDANWVETTNGGDPLAGGYDGSPVWVLSDYEDLYDMHAVIRADATIDPYYRTGVWDGTGSPTDADYERGRREWFAQSFAAWMVYSVDTTAGASFASSANGTTSVFADFRAFMDSLGLD
jgi:hypothetical protein